MTRTTTDWTGNIVAFALTIVVNAMATRIPLGGQTPTEISARYPALFTPSGFTFGIWGVIYLGLLLYVIYQALPGQRYNSRLADVDALFKASCLANAAWIIAWHYNLLVTSVGIMLCLLFCLVRIYVSLRAYRPVTAGLEGIVVHLPFQVYTAWISVAIIANISAVQIAHGFDDAVLSAVSWTLLKLALAGGVAAIMVLRARDIPFALVVAWAAFGIADKQAETPAVYGAATTVWMACLLLVAYESVRRGIRRR